MCGGGGQEREKVRAENQQKRLNQIASNRQKDLDRLSEERMILAQQQQARSVALQAQYAEAEASQTTKVAEMKAEQAAKLEGIQAAADAANTVSASLQAGGGQPQPIAPTAVVTKKRTKSRSPGQTSSSLTIGSTAKGVGSGSNLSI